MLTLIAMISLGLGVLSFLYYGSLLIYDELS